MKILGIKSIAYGTPTTDFDTPVLIHSESSGDNLSWHTTFSMDDFESLFGLLLHKSSDAKLRYAVRVKTKRKPRKMKKMLKKQGKYASQRTFNMDNVEINATFSQ